MIPFYADYINAFTSGTTGPSQVHVTNTQLYEYFRRHLLHKTVSVFRWNLPEWWKETLFLYTLYCDGHVAVVETDKFGVIPQPCSLGGRGVQYEPTYAIIANPLIRGIMQPRIGSQCAIIHLMPDYGGLLDIVNYYAREMAVLVETMEINALNSKLSYVFGVPKENSKAGAESLKKMFDQILSGVPASFVDKDLVSRDGKPTWSMFTQDVGKNFIVPEIQEAIRRLECQFAAAVGIPSNLATSKKERVTTVEVDANNVETVVGPSSWLDTARKDLGTANRLFGLNMSVDWRFTPDVQNDTINSGSIQSAE